VSLPILPKSSTTLNSARDAAGGLSARIRTLRERAGLSGAELAQAASVSKSLVSQIERGLATPSLETVYRIAAALDVPAFALFLEGTPNKTVLRRGERPVIRYPGTQAEREILTPGVNGRMVVLWVTYPPDFPASDQEFPPGTGARHEGEECVVVIRGTLGVVMGDERITLNEGDSATFDSEVPHRFYNPTSQQTEIIAAISPPHV
jgi:transcriptional regulator with XRE-family HTH domain